MLSSVTEYRLVPEVSIWRPDPGRAAAPGFGEGGGTASSEFSFQCSKSAVSKTRPDSVCTSNRLPPAAYQTDSTGPVAGPAKPRFTVKPATGLQTGAVWASAINAPAAKTTIAADLQSRITVTSLRQFRSDTLSKPRWEMCVTVS